MSRRPALVEPRLLSRGDAASYCGVSLPTFEAECPVAPIRFRSRVLYDRAKLDQWIDSLPVENRPRDISQPAIRAEANPWDS